jgi:AcrR family transcriptional regulator
MATMGSRGRARTTGSPAAGAPTAHNGPLFTVSELAEKTGVSVHSIHHYRRLGLLPEPLAAARNRYYYDQGHVDALRAIRFLRETEHLPLATIGDVMPLLAGTEADEGFEQVVRDLAEDLQRSGPALPPARLLSAARDAFARHGYEMVNVEDLCSEAGVAKGSFYRYFASKEEIFVAAARSTVDAVGDELSGSECLSDHEAVEALRTLLAPLVPLYLEVLAREMRGEQRMSGVFAGITDDLVSRIAPRLRARGHSTIDVARRVLEAALLGLVRPVTGAP